MYHLKRGELVTCVQRGCLKPCERVCERMKSFASLCTCELEITPARSACGLPRRMMFGLQSLSFIILMKVNLGDRSLQGGFGEAAGTSRWVDVEKLSKTVESSHSNQMPCNMQCVLRSLLAARVVARESRIGRRPDLPHVTLGSSSSLTQRRACQCTPRGRSLFLMLRWYNIYA